MEKNKLIKNQEKFPLIYQDTGVNFSNEKNNILEKTYRSIPNIQNPLSYFVSNTFYKPMSRFL